MHLESVAIIVQDYDSAIEFFVDIAGNPWDLLGPVAAII